MMEQQMITLCVIWSSIATEMFYFQHICTLSTQLFSIVKCTINTNISNILACGISQVVVVLLLLADITVLGNISNQKLLITRAYSAKSLHHTYHDML